MWGETSPLCLLRRAEPVMPRLSDALGFTGQQLLVAPSPPHTSAGRGPSFPIAHCGVGSVGPPQVPPHPPPLPGKVTADNSC